MQHFFLLFPCLPRCIYLYLKGRVYKEKTEKFSICCLIPQVAAIVRAELTQDAEPGTAPLLLTWVQGALDHSLLLSHAIS